MHAEDRRRRVVIGGVTPEVDCGRFPIKRVVGESVVVEADVYADGHDAVACELLYRREGEAEWQHLPMRPLVNDRWQAEFTVTAEGRWEYSVEGWVDAFRSWRRDMAKRIEAQQDVAVDLLVGARLVEQAGTRAAVVSPDDAKRLHDWAQALSATNMGAAEKQALAMNQQLAAVALRNPGKELATRYHRVLHVAADRLKARFSTWYELFPRSWSPVPGKHGTFRDVEARLDYVASMGFDVLYLPPIHPIGRSHRKGRNNATTTQPGDVGSPWAIGGEEGGHTAIHPDLGTLEDFRRLVAKAAEHGLEVAMDLAYQCSPDHPYVKKHPDWFRRRPDGSIQYAENPPKKYQDIYPIEFESEDWQNLWKELRDVILYWVEQGIQIFRVDNPHTKAFPFWEWAIEEVKSRHPGVLFLSEAFTRPKVMYQLAKLGFTQSYTYFTWRNTKAELIEYFTELTQPPVREFFRPNLWPNTPDILPEYLQFGGRPAFIARLVLAATLGASYGIYGPAFELTENQPRQPGSEEYLNSEKYEIRQRDLDSAWSLRDLITRVNQARRDNLALQTDRYLRFHETDNEMLLCYSKVTADFSNVILVVVNLDFAHAHSGWITLDLKSLGLDETHPYQVHDLLGDNRHLWTGRRNFVQLDPHIIPAHVFRLRRKVRTERDFDYFL
jgi:starch synthase (maltosyl-transferring)